MKDQVDILMEKIGYTKPKDELCSKCETNPKEILHPCPFEVDIHNNSATLCDCCNSCADACAMEI